MSAFWETGESNPRTVVQDAAPVDLRGVARRRVKRLAAESALRLLGPPRTWLTPPSLTGLCYHGVVRSTQEARKYYDPRLLTSRGFLSRQLELVSRWFDLIPASHATPAMHCGAVVTFDDAFVNILSNAVELLQHWRVPATTFVNDSTTGGDCLWHDVLGEAAPEPRAAQRRVCELKRAGRDEIEQAVAACGGRTAGPRGRYMSWDQLRGWMAAGFDVGGHTRHHYVITQLDDEELSAEVHGNRAAIARALGTPPVAFAFPNGDHDRRTRVAALDAGYSVAFEIQDQPGEPDAFSLPRRNICDAMCADEHGDFSAALFLAEITGILRRPAWSLP